MAGTSCSFKFILVLTFQVVPLKNVTTPTKALPEDAGTFFGYRLPPSGNLTRKATSRIADTSAHSFALRLTSPAYRQTGTAPRNDALLSRRSPAEGACHRLVLSLPSSDDGTGFIYRGLSPP
jgi:hypothetical protein